MSVISDDKVIQVYDENVRLRKILDQISSLVEGMDDGFVKTEIKKLLIKRKI